MTTSRPEATTRVHAFRDDALGEHDAVGLAAAIRRGEIGAAEAARDAAERVRAAADRLHAVQVRAADPTAAGSHAEPVRNPWNTGHSAGGSSGGSAALVTAGAVPIAHANGGDSIRVPAACCDLVALKPTRGRGVRNAQSRQLPIDLVVDGVVSRSVRDTAAFPAVAERHWRNPQLPPVGLVEGPSGRRLGVGLLLDSPNGVTADAATRAAVNGTAQSLERLGHTVEPVHPAIDPRFTDDFLAGDLPVGVMFSARCRTNPARRGVHAGGRAAVPADPGCLRRVGAPECCRLLPLTAGAAGAVALGASARRGGAAEPTTGAPAPPFTPGRRWFAVPSIPPGPPAFQGRIMQIMGPVPDARARPARLRGAVPTKAAACDSRPVTETA
ncbi:amidase family protein [Streptomyces sp. NPDC058872]|uniref:amidase family protein n=1 Tax=Streptomyces sp. NPDC058872 TaxID=3346661 RepID=UPI0036817E73